VIVFCGAAPTDDPEWDSWDGEADINLREFAAAREGMEAFELETAPYVERARADPVSALDYLAEHVPEPDRRVITRPEFRTAFAEHAAEPFRNGIAGWLDDDLAFLKPWGFRLEDVHVPVRLWQGADDLLVPRRHGEYLASKLPNARLELLPDTGHFLIDHMETALTWLSE
jgi:pimeloyl-ACP methyl ester carboxylesterase